MGGVVFMVLVGSSILTFLRTGNTDELYISLSNCFCPYKTVLNVDVVVEFVVNVPSKTLIL